MNGFTTNEKGEIHINNLQPGKYKIEEISNPYYGYTVMASKEITVVSGKENETKMPNEKQLGDIKIHKVDRDTRRTIT